VGKLSNEKGHVFFKALLSLFLVGLIVGSGLFIFLNQETSEGTAKEILIPRGSSIASVSNLLLKEEVVPNATVFKWVLRLTGGSRFVRAGEYRFKTDMSYLGALNVLYREEPIVHQITVPEGWSIRQIAEILSVQKLVDKNRFLNLALHPTAPTRYKLSSPTLEGFLYPDTYTFSRLDGEERIIERMVAQFFHKYDDTLKRKAAEIGWPLEKVVTLASIIEKETGLAEERPIISSVFHNRLKKKMRLQSDPTTIYGIEAFNGNLTRADLLRHTPYNTYKIPALPPGAIANPGLGALKAVLFPANTEYFYFVADGTGRHIFSKTYNEHQRHVNNYQVNPKQIGKR
jgi:UPF0755 protein